MPRKGGILKLGFEIKGISSIKKKLDKFTSQVLESQVQAVAESVLLIHETAVRKINDNGDGTPVIRYDPKRIVNASNPGDPPNTDKGRLVQSIKFDFKKNGLVGRVGTNLKYGAWLEFGTNKMEARPWLAPSVQEVSLSIGEIFSKNVSKNIKDAEK